MEQLIVSPLRPIELILEDSAVRPHRRRGDVHADRRRGLLVRHPLRGSLAVLFGSTVIYLLTITLGIGLFISTVSSTQEAMLSTFFFFPRTSSRDSPTRYATCPCWSSIPTSTRCATIWSVLRGVFLKGDRRLDPLAADGGPARLRSRRHRPRVAPFPENPRQTPARITHACVGFFGIRVLRRIGYKRSSRVTDVREQGQVEVGPAMEVVEPHEPSAKLFRSTAPLGCWSSMTPTWCWGRRSGRAYARSRGRTDAQPPVPAHPAA